MSINSFTYNGVSSESLGLYVGGQQTFGSPQRDVTKVSIPGRNGDLVRDNGRFMNAEIAYNVVAMSDFKNKAQSVRNWLMSAKGYKRLEDTYHPEHYRMARVADSVDFETGAFNATGKAKIIFDCMPQRFLKSGETAISGDPVERSASGEIASFETDYVVPMTSAEVSLSPQQDLNGFDSPWPAGGGKNKLPNTAQTATVQGVTFTVKADGTIVANGTSTGWTGITVGTCTLAAGTWYLQSGVASGTSNYFLETTIDGVTYNTNANPTKEIILSAEKTFTVKLFARPGQALSNVVCYPMIRAFGTGETYAPYSNICPISGQTGAELIRTGKNLAPKGYDNETTVQGVRITPTENGVKVVGTVTSRFALSLMSTSPSNRHVPLAAGEKVTFSLFVSGDISVAEAPPFIGYYANNVYGGNIGNLRQESGYKLTWTVTEKYANADDSYVRAYVYLPANAVVDFEIGFMMELGSSATAYEPYQGDTYSVTFSDQGTVYGGTFDFVSGKLTVTHKSMLGSETTWSMSNGVAYCTPNPTKKAGRDNFYCSAYEVTDVYWRNLTNGETSGYTNNNIFVKNDAWSSATDAAADLASVQFVYELDTPLEYTLSPQQIETLLGENNVWSDEGEISLTFYEPAELDNPTPFDSKPLIRAYGSGNGQVTIGNQIIALTDINGYIDIDCETMNCYNGVENCNSKVTLGTQGFPTLPPGITAVSFSGGVTKVEITPRWWEL